MRCIKPRPHLYVASDNCVYGLLTPQMTLDIMQITKLVVCVREKGYGKIAILSIRACVQLFVFFLVSIVFVVLVFIVSIEHQLCLVSKAFHLGQSLCNKSVRSVFRQRLLLLQLLLKIGLWGCDLNKFVVFLSIDSVFADGVQGMDL